MNAGWAVREDWAASNMASFSNGFEKLKTVGDKLQEHSKKVKPDLFVTLHFLAAAVRCPQHSFVSPHCTSIIK